MIAILETIMGILKSGIHITAIVAENIYGLTISPKTITISKNEDHRHIDISNWVSQIDRFMNNLTQFRVVNSNWPDTDEKMTDLSFRLEEEIKSMIKVIKSNYDKLLKVYHAVYPVINTIFGINTFVSKMIAFYHEGINILKTAEQQVVWEFDVEDLPTIVVMPKKMKAIYKRLRGLCCLPANLIVLAPDADLRTILHEYAHWTAAFLRRPVGSISLLGRCYRKEETVAEMAAYLTMVELGLPVDMKASKEYIDTQDLTVEEISACMAYAVEATELLVLLVREGKIF